MKKDDDLSPDHLEWLVRCRSQNQKTSLALFKILKPKSARLKKNTLLASTGVSLVAISFSLWRAVFLADRGESYDDTFDDALQFLGKLILDNAIAYTQDRGAREWTFRYYLNNARFRLIGVSERTGNILPNFSPPKNLNSRQTWEYYQDNLDLAVRNYANAVNRL